MKLLLLALTAAPCLGLGIDGYDGGDPCTTLGPATMQLRTSRGATTAAGFKTAALGVAAAQSAAACQARCCTTGSCAAWSFSSSRCELLGGVVGAAASNGSATSGVVYRPAAGTPPLTKKQPSGLNASDIRGFNYVPVCAPGPCASLPSSCASPLLPPGPSALSSPPLLRLPLL